MDKRIFIVLLLLLIFISAFRLVSNKRNKNIFSEKTKVTLREVGHQLLLSNRDSTSLVLPVLELEKIKYRISFDKNLEIAPNKLLPIITNSFKKASLPVNYIIEVFRCSDAEVAYSFEISNGKENSIIPCLGRKLEKDCYFISVLFISTNEEKPLLGIIVFFALVLVSLLFYLYKNKQASLEKEDVNQEYIVIGNYQFDIGQNRLIIGSKEINLSKKECEILSIFMANPNKIVKREELSKKVWEIKEFLLGEV